MMHSIRPSLVPLGLACLVLLHGSLAAQEHTHDHASPYAGYAGREIVALSPEEMDGLREGRGLEMALPAELHGYPGPRHVLDMAGVLGLTPEQQARTQAIFDAMQAEARRLGTEILALERELDRDFADGRVTEARLAELADAIGARRARLRTAHLRAHLELYPVLTADQRAHYARARGYRE